MPAAMRNHRIPALAAVVAFLALGGPVALAGGDEPPANPATVNVAVAPDAVAPGASVEVTVQLVPGPGIKINRYPKISLKIPALDGVVAEADGAVGNERPPSVDEMEAGKNYFKTVDPLRLSLQVDPAASAGGHVVPAKLKYFYCVAASGFCAPKKVDVEIPLNVR